MTPIAIVKSDKLYIHAGANDFHINQAGNLLVYDGDNKVGAYKQWESVQICTHAAKPNGLTDAIKRANLSKHITERFENYRTAEIIITSTLDK